MPMPHLAVVDLGVVGVLREGEVPHRPLAEAVVPVEEGEERQVGLVPLVGAEVRVAVLADAEGGLG